MMRIFKASLISSKSLCIQKEKYEFSLTFLKCPLSVRYYAWDYLHFKKTALQGKCVEKVGLESGPH